ncbi:MAG: NAD(P)/FAD-dependent oxidoreductase [Mycobacteriales bacterium]
MSQEQTFVIVGASLAGAKAAETLREHGFEGHVVLIGEETERPYERPPLSKDYLVGKAGKDKIYVHEEGWYADHEVTLRLGTRVSAIDRDARELSLPGGERLGYDALLLTTGSIARRLPVPGDDLDGVHYLRRVEESDRLRETLSGGGRVVVIGAGWIGLEGAAAARAHGCEVTVIEPEPGPLHRILGAEVGALFTDLHRSHGVDLRFGSGVREIGGTAGHVTHVVMSDGTTLDADAVLVGVGIQPATELAEEAGLFVEDGIRVDSLLRTTRDEHIFAAGDVMRADHPLLGVALRVEHWANALNSGPAAARSMLGKGAPYDRVPYFFSDQYDEGLEFSGWFAPGGYDDVVIRGDRESRQILAFWLAGGRVLAGLNLNVWDVTEPIQALIRSGTVVNRHRLADPQVPLGEIVVH